MLTLPVNVLVYAESTFTPVRETCKTQGDACFNPQMLQERQNKMLIHICISTRQKGGSPKTAGAVRRVITHSKSLCEG